MRYSNPEATVQEIEDALKAANAWDFVQKMEKGVETNVGGSGGGLSGGQKQRIAIARAILNDPKILILDEATSSLDSESEHLVQEGLEKLMENRTTFIIAHRLSTIKDCDRIIVLEKGEIKEIGSHNDLMAIENGAYRKLKEMQIS